MIRFQRGASKSVLLLTAASICCSYSLSPRSKAATRAIRSFETAADRFFQAHRRLPEPPVRHAQLENLCKEAPRAILIVGDVHGCYNELMALHERALLEAPDIDCVILVGDLVNKGPDSAKVLRHVRETPNWFSVRGNHEQGALKAALRDPKRMNRSTYNWIVHAKLSDSEVQWIADMPFTIRISKRWWDTPEPVDRVVVHGGLVPGVALDKQDGDVMVTLRDLRCDVQDTVVRYEALDKEDAKEERVGWASCWDWKTEGCYVVFGHDARRGLQEYDGVIGLDSGACYGKKLSGLVLERNGKRTIVQTDAEEVHCPIK